MTRIRHRTHAAWLALVALLAGGALQAATTIEAPLRIEVISAYNLVVDSNIETPAGGGPTACHLGVRIYNDGATAITDVYARIGDITNAADWKASDVLAWTGTAGTYPTTTVSSPYSGTFSFTHQGGTADATRFIGTIDPGQYVAAYWFVSYPVKDGSENSVAGDGSDLTDDLRLDYDIWVEAKEGAATLRAYDLRSMYCRSELSASANKIWPNTTSKVPPEYLDAVNLVQGWRSQAPAPRVPNAVVVEGIWYDFGRVIHGFDNDGDGVPDYNAWAQPVGNPATYDATAFRLVMAYGVLIVKLNDGTEQLILFENELYFENLPENNTGVVGLVYYEFAALRPGAATSTSPYQEAASGQNTEKFNADFGRAIVVPAATPPDVTFNKTGDATVSVGGTVSYTLYTRNDETDDPNDPNDRALTLGDPSIGNYLVWSDTIPTGTVYVAGSATANNTPTTGWIVYYYDSTTLQWTATEPLASRVSKLEWWLDGTIEPAEAVSVRFQVTVPSGYTSAYVSNCATFGSSNGATAASDCATTFITGTRTVSGTVFADTSTGATYADGVLNGTPTESGIGSIGVSLYVDLGTVGVLDSADLYWGSVDSLANGTYSFTNLPSTTFLVVVDQTDSNLSTGYALTSQATAAADVTNADSIRNDFGFAPALQLDKELIGTGPVYEGDLVSYTITATNTRPGDGSGLATVTVTTWGGTLDATHTGTGTKAWQNPGDAVGSPNGTYATAPFANAQEQVAVTSFATGAQTGTVSSVAVVALINVDAPASFNKNDEFTVRVLNHATGTQLFSATYSPSTPGSLSSGELVVPVTGLSTSWATYTGSTYCIQLESKGLGSDTGVIRVDAVGFRVTGTTAATSTNTLNPVPLRDTFDADLMQFVSASPAQASVTTGGTQPDDGIINWTNIGPIYPGATKTVTVTFRALNPTNTQYAPTNEPPYNGVRNTAIVDQATYQNGVDCGDDSKYADVTLNPTTTIGDFVWSDLAINGNTSGVWDANEPGIPNVTVYLDANNNNALDSGETSTTTSASGYYYFTGLRGTTSTTYNIRVLTTTLPGGSGTCTYDLTSPADSHASVTLAFTGTTAPADVLTADFGYNITSSIIRGTLWNDLDRAGEVAPETGEPYLANVAVGLFPPGSDTPIATTTTDANGYYQFITNNTVSGPGYTVRVTTGTGDMLTGTWNASYDTDGTSSADRVTLPSIVVGSVSQADFSYYQTGTYSIGDTVFFDWDKDGTQDGGEIGIPGVTVRLYNASGFLLATTTTDSSGIYSFAGRAGGTYVVVVDESAIPAGFTQTTDPGETGVCTVCDAQHTVTISASVDTVDFGYGPTGTSRIGDMVWYDANGNARQDLGEGGIPGVTVRLYLDADGNGLYSDAGDFLLATTTTADGTGGSLVGYYAFNNVAAPTGTQRYIVEVVPPTVGGYTLALTSDPDRDGVPCSAGGLPACDDKDTGIEFTGGNYLAADFGFQPRGVIGDYVWRDQDADGIQDTGETGFAGVAVRVTNGTTTYDTTTDADGYYSFYGLANGTWTVSLPTPPTGYTPTYDRDGGLNNSAVVTLSAGEVVLNADFGLRTNGTYSLSGTICINDRGPVADPVRVKGLCDDVDNFLDDGTDLDLGPYDETELAGIPFYLYIRGGTDPNYTWTLIATTFSDADGNYTFGSLPDGTYRIVTPTTASPLDNATLNTTDAQTPADTIDTSFGTSVIQTVTISGASLTDLDLAFSSTVDRDYGDLPLSYGITTLNQDGARHIIPTGGATRYLGSVVPDADPNGAPTAYATGDDSLDNADDEDGVVPLEIADWTNGADGGSVQVTVHVPNGQTAYLMGWVDFNHDNTVLDAGDLIVSQPITGDADGVQVLTIDFDIPDTTIGGTSESWLARFRIVADEPALPVFAYAGEFTDGEVEDVLFQRTVGGSIGDFVWNDVNNNGIQDAGEDGVGGVTVTLSGGGLGSPITANTSNGSQDVDGDGIIDPLGYYRFVGLSNGTYTVTASLPAGFTGFSPQDQGGSDVLDSDADSSGAVTGVVVEAGSQTTSVDVGLVPVFADISGTVFLDSDGTRTFSAGDTARSGVVVELWTDPNGDGDPADGRQVGESVTGANGAYSFAHMPTGRYVVIENDPPGLLSVTDTDETPSSPNRIRVNLTGTNSTGNNFLDYIPVPTAAVVSSLRGLLVEGVAVIEWETTSEASSSAFRLLRDPGDGGEPVQVGEEGWLASLGELRGGVYRVADLDVVPGQRSVYHVEELETSGIVRPYGPFEVRIPHTKNGAGLTLEDLGTLPRPMAEARRQRETVGQSGKLPGQDKAVAATRPALPASLAAVRVQWLRILVPARGVHFVTSAAVASALGVTETTVRRDLTSRVYELSCGGSRVGYIPAAGGAGFYFLGEAYRSQYTTTNVYWLTRRFGVRGSVPPSQACTQSPAPVAAAFWDTVHAEDQSQPLPGIVQDAADDVWFWSTMLGGSMFFGSTSQAITPPALAVVPHTARLTVRLYSGNSLPTTAVDHWVQVSLNGTPVGSAQWDGQRPYEWSADIPSSLLVAGVNTVALTALKAPGVSFSKVLLDWMELDYLRRYEAAANYLEFDAASGDPIAVTGFTAAAVSVWRVDDPATPVVLTGTSVTGSGPYTVRFVAPASGRYVAFAPGGAAVASTLAYTQNLDLSRRTNRLDWVAIAPAALAASAQALADYRASQGLAAGVLALEDVQFAFSDGRAEPAAVRQLLSYARGAWRAAPRYVVLVGEGTYDYMDRYLYHDNLMPPLLVATPFGLTASDVAQGDADGDGAPETAVGRIPALNAAELAMAVRRLIGVEASYTAAWPTDVVVAADYPGLGGDFVGDSDRLAAEVLAGLSTERLYMSQYGLSAARSLLQQSLRSGTHFVTYAGHGGYDRLQAEGLLMSADVPNLANAPRLPVLTAATCVINGFAEPGGDSLGERLVLQSDGGAAAVWAPGGLAYHDQSMPMVSRFYQSVVGHPGSRLGDAVLDALRAEPEPVPGMESLGIDGRRWFNLLGDPALRLP